MCTDLARDNGNGNPLQRFEALASDCNFHEYIILGDSRQGIFIRVAGTTANLATIIYSALHHCPELVHAFVLALEWHMSDTVADSGPDDFARGTLH